MDGVLDSLLAEMDGGRIVEHTTYRYALKQ